MTDNYSALVAKPHVIKLSGASNYRTWSKDLEMVLIRMGCWEVTTEALPAAANRDDEWKKKNNWARSEIHLGCNPDQQELILDSETAFDSWKILKDEYARKGEIMVQRLRKEFASVRMTESKCGEYVNRVRKLVSELKACGVAVKDTDVAYTLLMGLPDKYSSLVVTLTNMATEAAPLKLSRVVESVLTEEMRMSHVNPAEQPVKKDPNESNPLAFKGDTSFRGELQHAMVARTQPQNQYRQMPYQPRGGMTRGYQANRGGYIPRGSYGQTSGYSYGQSSGYNSTTGYAGYSGAGRGAVTQVFATTNQATTSKGDSVVKDISTLPWKDAPWQPRLRTAGEERMDVYTAQQDSRQCYGCGGWGHIRKNCYHEHPELHPANREWLMHHLATMEEEKKDANTKEKKIGWKAGEGEQANVMIGFTDESESDEDKIEHPFEMNMVMEIGSEIGTWELCPHLLLTSGVISSSCVASSIVSHDRSALLNELDVVQRPLLDSQRQWLLDSGASSHYVKNIERFIDYDVLAKPIKIRTGSGPIWAVARGSVALALEKGMIVVVGVLLVPDLAVETDLLSVPALMRQGFGVNFQEGTANIVRNGEIWGSAVQSGGDLFYVQEFHVLEDYALAMKCTDVQPLDVWHKRLGHLSARTIKGMGEAVTGLKVGSPNAREGERNVDCVDCLKGTQHQTISRFPYTPASKPLERVSFDIAGPMKTPDCTWNYKHMILLVDHYTRHLWLFPLISRDMALKAFNIWKMAVERNSGFKVQVIQSDNAGEFMGKKWTDVCQKEGIEHITTAPYGPSMNAYAERIIRTIVGHASSMLFAANIKEEFWALACKATAYLYNRSPHSSLSGRTPYELWHGSKPGMGHIRIWGCRAWAAVPKEKRKKFDSRTKECVLVGFYDSESLYQLWDVQAKQLIKRRDVVFQESVMGHPLIARSEISQVDILGEESVPDVEEKEDLEDLYAVIELDEEWDGMPMDHLPVDEMLVSETFPTTYKQAMGSDKKDLWEAAMKVEVATMVKNEVFEWVSVPEASKVLPSKWVYALKRAMDGTIEKYKARIVAGGHRQGEGDFRETFAPVAKFVSLRILLTLAAIDDLEVEQVDVVAAFLHGELEEELFMRAPQGVEPEVDKRGHPKVWRLRKSIYGLKQSPRCFYMKLDDVLKVEGFTRIAADWGVWVLKLRVVVLVHVDDMNIIGGKEDVEWVVSRLASTFQIKRLGPSGTALFLGLQLARDRNRRKFLISQGNYARRVLIRFGMTNANDCDTPMERGVDWTIKPADTFLTEDQRRIYQAAIGSLIYLVLGSRPDMAFAVNKLAQFSSKPTQRHWLGVKKVLRFLKGTVDTTLELGCNGENGGGVVSEFSGLVVGYFDAAFMDDTGDRHSTMGYAFYCAGSLISWCSRKQRTVALSTTEAEYLAGTEATKEAVWIQVFLTSLGLDKSKLEPVLLLGDNQGANALTKNPEYHSRTKHIHVRQRFITEMWECGKIDVKYVATSAMVADVLTKALPRDAYWKFFGLLRLSVERRRLLVAMEEVRMCAECGKGFQTGNQLHKHLKIGCGVWK